MESDSEGHTHTGVVRRMMTEQSVKHSVKNQFMKEIPKNNTTAQDPHWY